MVEDKHLGTADSYGASVIPGHQTVKTDLKLRHNPAIHAPSTHIEDHAEM